MTLYWRMKVNICMRAPWAIPGEHPPGPRIDVPLARSGDHYILPATLIKGNLRDAMDQLVLEEQVSASLRDHLFGTKSGTRRAGAATDPWKVENEPERGALILSDLKSETPAPAQPGRVARVEIDPELRAAREGQLAFIECPHPFGTEILFSSDAVLKNVSIPGVTKPDISEVLDALDMATARVFAIGGMKSVGFGRILRADFEEPRAVASAQISAPADLVHLEYTLDRPFLVDSNRHSGNLSVGSDVLPGGAIKAVLAESFEAAGDTGASKFLSDLHVSFAQPEGRKPLPLSLSISENSLFCNLHQSKKSGRHRFRPDWKGEEESVRSALGPDWEHVEKDILKLGKSRTAIETSTLSAAYERNEDDEEGSGLLFSQVLVSERKRDGQKLTFTGKLLGDKSDPRFSQSLGMLKAGLLGFGKTGAVLTGRVADPLRQENNSSSGELNLCLMTPACLFTPADVEGRTVPDLYSNYFSDLGFELINFFATQSLRGRYLALRYRHELGKYAPWIMTDPGSVFQLKPNGEADLNDLVNRGLPPAKSLSTDWRKFPFLRENGFGEVLQDAIPHSKLATKGIKL